MSYSDFSHHILLCSARDQPNTSLMKMTNAKSPEQKQEDIKQQRISRNYKKKKS